MSALRRLVLAAFVAVALAPSLAARDARDVDISPRAMQHIVARHGPESHARDAGHFAPGTTPAQIRALIEAAVRQGAERPDTGNRPATLYDFSFSQEIGVTEEGRPTRRLRVVVGTDGAVVTAYPR